MGWVALDVTTPEGTAPVEVASDRMRYHVRRGGTTTVLEIRTSANRLVATCEGVSTTFHFAVHNEIVNLSHGGAAQEYRIAPLIDHAGAIISMEKGGAGRVAAPMPGLISKLNVSEGQQVTQGDSVIVLEAMKLMYNLPAQISGRVAQIFCTAGDTVAAGTPLIDIKPID
jgi:biotin carboxyl carrier protein